MADFLLYDCGSIVQLTPQTDSAKEWLQENVENVESEGWQWLGNGLCMDRRMAVGVVEAIVEEGMVLA